MTFDGTIRGKCSTVTSTAEIFLGWSCLEMRQTPSYKIFRFRASLVVGSFKNK